MRLRHIRGGRSILEAHPNEIILDPAAHRGRWRNLFGNDRPLHLEIGMGKGQFVMGMAQLNPEANYIGMERMDSAAVRALHRLLAQPLPNVRMVVGCASKLEEGFAEGEVDRLLLNFSDPWPKKSHAKRRLTHVDFLDRYRKVLAPGAELHFKTDDRRLFEFTLEHLSQHGWRFESVNLDLHAAEPEDNVRTEYEEAFACEGHPIFRLVARAG
ncbi:MAG TPA: tRNA (guanosine(46)-N7)-methyltransferase TrmB [Holophagaceae bacterium]|nr:tRNA (guanosine(46)-N7)-methyltransferase TrmB [Holophagaceae bacterium]